MLRQADLFNLTSEQAMTVSEVADTLSVSEASVRNWIKTGYLQFERHVGVSRQSFELFRHNVVGKDKLTKRANKSFSKSYSCENSGSEILQGNDIKTIANSYIDSLSNAYRNKEGIYYTPESICRILLSDIKKPINNQLFCDPCCGSGNFIIEAIRHGFSPENIYGYDTDPIAVEITKRRIFEKTGIITNNIVCIDFLKFVTDLNNDIPVFDVVATNPPWGKKISKDEKLKYGKLFGVGRSLDTSALFFWAALRVLKNNGFLALLLPEAFFKIAVFQDARRELLQYKMITVRDFGKPFKGLITKAYSFCVQKTKYQAEAVCCVTKGSSFERAQSSFSKNPANIINFETCPKDELVLSRLFKVPYITLENNADWGLGIVTGNNNKFCRSVFAEGLIPVYKGVDVHKTHLAEPTNFIAKKFSLYQQVAPLTFFEAEEKLMYRFISDKLVFYHDKRRSFCLNSVNMLIPHKNFPISQAYLADIFNTDLFSWVFNKLFDTHKVLRADLEKLPLPIEFLQGKENFSEQDLLEYYHLTRERNGTFRVKE